MTVEKAERKLHPVALSSSHTRNKRTIRSTRNMRKEDSTTIDMFDTWREFMKKKGKTTSANPKTTRIASKTFQRSLQKPRLPRSKRRSRNSTVKNNTKKYSQVV